MVKTAFRGDIQGLRALAVIVVLLFHIDVSLFDGGFLGVDIFFVISGFLITGNILWRYEGGTFTFSDFFMRRFKRLVPASVITVLLTLLAAYFLLTPSLTSAAGQSGFHALLFSSNIDFWLQSGYFASEASTKPFLHFWSLSVEEQFYFVWPLLIVGVLSFSNRKSLAGILAVLTLVSLVAAEMMLTSFPGAVFFLMPFRIFEFGIGGLIVIIGFKFTHKMVNEIAIPIGLALMLGSIILMDGATRMPGLLTLIPLIGCGLILASGPSKFSFLLENKIAVLIGNASYSIYLVHWPLVVLCKLYFTETLSPVVQLVIFILSIGLGFAMWRFVENPFRRETFWQTTKLRGLPQVVFLGLCLATLYFAANLWAKNTVSLSGQNTARITDPKDLRIASLEFAKANTVVNDTDPAKVVVIGDSHGTDFANVMTYAGATLLKKLDSVAWCQPVVGERPDPLVITAKKNATNKQVKECEQRSIDNLSKEKLAGAELVIFAPRWKDWTVPFLEETIEYAKEVTDADIIVVGVGATLKQNVPRFVEENIGEGDLNALAETISRPERQYNPAIATIALKKGVAYLDRYQLQCENLLCPIIDADTGGLLFFDDNHLTLPGAKFLAEQISKCDEPACKMIMAAVGDQNVSTRLAGGSISLVEEQMFFALNGNGLRGLKSRNNLSPVSFDNGVVSLVSSAKSPRPDGSISEAFAIIPRDLESLFSGKMITITVEAKQMTDNPSSEFALTYSTNENGNSGWRIFKPTEEYATFQYDYSVPKLPDGAKFNADYLGIYADTLGSGGGIDIRKVEIKQKG